MSVNYETDQGEFGKKTIKILEMIAMGVETAKIYNEIALLYESRYAGLRCSMLELQDGILLHGGAPSLPQEYCEAIHGLEYGPDIGSCGTSTYTGKRCIVSNIDTDPKWQAFKHLALPHGMRCCWSEPIIDSKKRVLGAFGMYYNFPAEPSEQESRDLISAARLAGLVMERDQNQKRIRDLAYKDPLTGLASRAYFYEYIEDLIITSRRYGRTFSLLCLDLDDFKIINDTQGHDAGDLLLDIIAKRLSDTCRDADLISRLSGDEFCIITEHDNEHQGIARLAQRCIHAISQPVHIGTIEQQYLPSCSIGISNFPEDGDNTTSLLKAADTALYNAKAHGKKIYSFYRPELTRQAEYKLNFERDLMSALLRQQMYLVYQPKIDLKTQTVVGLEALSRWRHPKSGLISPLEFIPVAERIGVINDLTRWVLQVAASRAIVWKQHGFPDLRISVNISPSIFMNKKIVQVVSEALNMTGLQPELLELEVTENVFQTSEENVCVFSALKDIGVAVSIDDFGAGYSSFASLKHIEIDCLKIDKFFTQDMLVDDKSKHLIESMIDIGHKLNCDIVAEGTETYEQIAHLKSIGCDIAQGFLFSKPLTEEELILWMQKHTPKV